VLVVAKNLVGAARVPVGQRGTAPADFQDLLGEAARGAIAPHPLQAFLGGAVDGGGDGLAGEGRKLAYGFFGCRILDVERHMAPWKNLSTCKDSKLGEHLQMQVRNTADDV